MDYYEELVKLYQEYPELTFQNKGYQYLPQEVKERNQEGIDKINAILEKTVEGFVRFDNFKNRPDKNFWVRCQTKWSPSFTGVDYFKIEYFKKVSEKFEQAKKEICEELNIKSHEFEYIVNRLYDVHFEDIYFKTKEELLPLIKEELKNI